MVIVYCTIFFLYTGLIIALMEGWRKATKQTENCSSPGSEKAMVSVIVAARNEKAVIEHLLDDLTRQVYAPFEVIVIDDHSDDGMAAAIAEIVDNDPRFTLLHGVGNGKKQAIAQGIEAAKGSIILTTDADCRVRPYWTSEMSRSFANKETQFVFGAVTMQGEALFDAVQSIEFATLIATGAATASLGYPTMCNGANLAFRKEAFKEVNGYSGNRNIPSGDDEFLLRKIMDRYPDAVRFAGNSQSVVRTNPNNDIAQLFHQRIRWAGKWRHQTHFVPKALAIFIFCFHLSVLMLLPLALLSAISPLLAVALWCCKVFGELAFLRFSRGFLQVTWRWSAFVILQFLYSPYVIIIALLCNFRGFVWKGRKLNALTVSSN